MNNNKWLERIVAFGATALIVALTSFLCMISLGGLGATFGYLPIVGSIYAMRFLIICLTTKRG